jgi:hypothetical protein
MRRGKKLLPCPMPGCRATKTPMNYFCWDHWSALPMAIQQQILDTARKSGRHKTFELVQNAIKILERREKGATQEVTNETVA